MFIRRSKYEHDIQEAYEKGAREANERIWQNQKIDELRSVINALSVRVSRIEPHEENRRCP